MKTSLTKTIHIVLDDDDAKKLAEIANADSRTPTAWCRKVLVEAIQYAVVLKPSKARRA